MQLRAIFHVTLTLGPNHIFLVNAFPPKPLDIAASNFAAA